MYDIPALYCRGTSLLFKCTVETRKTTRQPTKQTKRLGTQTCLCYGYFSSKKIKAVIIVKKCMMDDIVLNQGAASVPELNLIPRLLVFDRQRSGFRKAKFVWHSDGGTRRDSCSAIAWFVEVILIRGDLRHTSPVAMSANFLSSPISSFTAECIASISFLRQR